MIFIYNRNDLNIPFKGDIDDYYYCISRERRIEIAILQYMEKQHNVKLLRYMDEVKAISKQFILRTTIKAYFDSELSASEYCINNRYLQNKVESWSNFDVISLTKRKTMEISIGSLLNNKELLLNYFSNEHKQIFVKTKDKNFSVCAPFDDMYIDLCYYQEHMGENAMMIISEPVTFEEEYRCFIVNNKVTCISTYDDYNYNDIPEEVTSFANECIKHFSTLQYISNYVLDVGVTKEKGLVLVECNDIGMSGRYINNDFCDIVEEVTSLKCDKKYKEFVDEHDQEIINYKGVIEPKDNSLKLEKLEVTFPNLFKKKI